jgi:cholesterol oxidase
MKNEAVYDYIVIGSGFGGSVSAMRLSQKGYSVLLLEKGKKYNDQDFPSTNFNIRKFLWMPFIKCFGIQKIDFFKKVMILSGTGLGGGSLVYANTHKIPSDEFFNHPSWASFNNWEKLLLPFYDLAKKILGTVKIKKQYAADNILEEIAKETNRGSTFAMEDVGVNFSNESDPYFNGDGPERKPCTECAACMIGCKENAKNTLMKNYLYFAIKNGIVIQTETEVEKIFYEDSLYHIETKKSTKFFSKHSHYKAKGIVLSAGVLGTLKLLFKQKYVYKTLNKISDLLGDNLRTNSESLNAVTSYDQKLNHGLAISSGFKPDDQTHIEIVKYPYASNLMRGLATIAIDDERPNIRRMKWFYAILKNPVKIFKVNTDKRWAEKSIIFLVMQNLNNSLKMTFKRFPFFYLSIKSNRGEKTPSYIKIGQETMRRFAKKVNGYSQNSLMEILFNMSTTAHIIGGCTMGDNDKTGVINPEFELINYPNFYVLDGSIIQANLGVNPSLTITALAEYAMSLIPEKTKP